ncbi:metallophosphoesterase [Nisaea acidiphila]|uniref:Metallophosphoesterase n=1 Tax=Nisaea acidiphila TaxID=1862145 RepID=A0A9J7AQK4_9PROT|nr:metallophosphoesterase [Nisaea acidiphila]UUX49680.1 metallophosphoesterase [Nisaea acidiphila]
MKILVISDIHAYNKHHPTLGSSTPSFVIAGDNAPHSPQSQLIDLIKAEDIQVDYVVCPGDLGDKADISGIEFSWNFLKSVTENCHARALIATTGNHDLDSRFFSGKYDPREFLQNYSHDFPVYIRCLQEKANPESMTLHYWALNFCLFSLDDIRFVILNSSAYHGYNAKDSVPELEHGRISAPTIDLIKKYIDRDNKEREKNGKNKYPINIFICHHHLKPDNSVGYIDKSEIIGASTLLDLLSDTDNGRWFAIHGHRHRSRLYQSEKSTGPWVLSAASFGKTTDGDDTNICPNQIHIVEFDQSPKNQMAQRVQGTVATWNWYPNLDGWQQQARPPSGLPPQSGFGWRGSIDDLARKIDNSLKGDYARWEQILPLAPELRYVTYSDMIELKKTLANHYNINSQEGLKGNIIELGRKS